MKRKIIQSFHIFTRKVFWFDTISEFNNWQNTEGELDFLYYFSGWHSLGINCFSLFYNDFLANTVAKKLKHLTMLFWNDKTVKATYFLCVL